MTLTFQKNIARCRYVDHFADIAVARWSIHRRNSPQLPTPARCSMAAELTMIDLSQECHGRKMLFPHGAPQN